MKFIIDFFLKIFGLKVFLLVTYIAFITVFILLITSFIAVVLDVFLVVFNMIQSTLLTFVSLTNGSDSSCFLVNLSQGLDAIGFYSAYNSSIGLVLTAILFLISVEIYNISFKIKNLFSSLLYKVISIAQG